MKYNVAMIVLVLLCAVVVADGCIKSNHDKQNLLRVRATVSAMSPQKLASGIADRDPVRWAGEHQRQNSTFCIEISRALDEQRLELVDVRPMTIPLPLSLPTLRLRKAEIMPLKPTDLTSPVEVFDSARAG